MPVTNAARWKATGSGEVEGYLSVFGVADREDDVTEPGAFAGVIKAWNLSGRRLDLVLDHDPTAVVGEVIELEEDSVGVKFRARFDSTPLAQQARHAALVGDVRGVSYAYTADRRAGRVKGRAVRIIERIRGLAEVTLSLLSRPVNPLAQLTMAKAGDGWPTMPVAPGRPAAWEVVTVAEQIRRAQEAPVRAELARKAAWVEAHGWPSAELTAAIGIPKAYEMAVTAYAAAEPAREAAAAAEAKARAEARAAEEWDRSWAAIQERAAQPCGWCWHCRRGLGCHYG
jgi:HK97 family phage prohead protease